jgi:predicted DNA-binding transcriptional regulator AlpA
MSETAEREVIGLPRVMELLGVGRTTMKKWRRRPDFPAPLTLPGHPRFYLDEILAYRDRRRVDARVELALEAYLGNAPEARALPAEDQRRRALEWYRSLEEDARQHGPTKAAPFFESFRTALERVTA